MLLLFFVVLLSPSAVSWTQDDSDATLTMIWTILDVNKNGKLELSEFTNAIYSAYDSNHDGEISEAEFVSYWSVLLANHESAVKSIFHQVDLFDDKVWKDSELSTMYFHMDSSGDEVVDESEFISEFSVVFQDTDISPGDADR